MIRQLGPPFDNHINNCRAFMDPTIKKIYELNANILKLFDL